MQLNRLLTILTIAVAVIGCEAPPPEDTLAEKLATVMEEAPEPPDLANVAPEAVSTLDRNQLMSIMLIELPPGAQIPEHDAGDRAVYALTHSSLLLKSEDTVDVETYLPGDVDVWSVGTYGIENAGDETARFIVVNRTSAPLETAIGTTTAGEAITQPENVTVLHSGQNFEIERVELTPKSTASLRCDSPCSVFTLTPASLVVDSDTGGPDVMDVFEDRAVWFDGGSTWRVNSNENEVGLVVVQLKN
jgi:hypothetical protein